MTVPAAKVKSTAPSSFQPEISRANDVALVRQINSSSWLPEAGLNSTAIAAMELSAGCGSGKPAFWVLDVPMGKAMFVTLCLP